MNGTQFVCAQLALRAYQDGYEEGLNGMLAIAFTIRNRVKLGWFGGNWIEVLNHVDSTAGEPPHPLVIPDPRNYAFNSLLQEIDGIVAGTRIDDITIKRGDLATFKTLPVALYYSHTNRITSDWFLENIARNPSHTRVASLATLTFWS